MSFTDKSYVFEAGMHNQKKVIWIRFERNQELSNYLQANTKAWWSSSVLAWYVTDCRHYRELFGLEQSIVGKEVINKIHPVNFPAFVRFQEQLKLKGYSENTIRTYSIEFAQLLYILKSFPVETLTPERLRSYFLYCHAKLKLSESEIQSRINAIKLFFEHVLHRNKMFFDIPRPKKPLTSPKMLNRNQVKKVMNVLDNKKHRLILKLCYGMGLLVSEVVRLKLTDIDSVTMLMRVEQAKGKKDRVMILPQSVFDELRTYYLEFKPKSFLFEGQNGGQYSIRSVQAIFKSAMKKSGITKNIGIHGLRHSYATHLLEAGTDISFIQELLGHKSLKTTQINTRVSSAAKSNIKSPLDSL
ncbi:MAG: tyrosine-type recombinase/integrase [Paludibacter sp.]|nr:tyrosine-type recombinase/integrase [Paludibacter sp.]